MQAVFWQEFHESRGDMQIRLSSWSRHTALGHVRELSFVSPIKVSSQQPKLPSCHWLHSLACMPSSLLMALLCIDPCQCCLLPKQMAYSLLLSLLSIPQANSASLSVLSESNKLTQLRRDKPSPRPHNSNMPPHLAPAVSTDGSWCTSHTHGCM